MPNRAKIQKLVNLGVTAATSARALLWRERDEIAATKYCASSRDMYCFFARTFLAAPTPSFAHVSSG